MLRWTWSSFPDLPARALHDALALRADVFVVEQDCAYADVDGRDPHAHHLLGVDDEQLCAYLRAFPPEGQEASIGRVVVARRRRGEGLGRALMEEGHRRVWRTWGPVPIHLSAQAHLRDFYGSLGYLVVGPGYDEDGIPHLPMTRPEAQRPPG